MWKKMVDADDEWGTKEQWNYFIDGISVASYDKDQDGTCEIIVYKPYTLDKEYELITIDEDRARKFIEEVTVKWQ